MFTFRPIKICFASIRFFPYQKVLEMIWYRYENSSWHSLKKWSFFCDTRALFVSHGGPNWFLICLDEYCTLWFNTTTTSNTYLCVQNLALLNSLKIFKSFLIANSLSEFAQKCITNALQPYLMTGCRGSPCQTLTLPKSLASNRGKLRLTLQFIKTFTFMFTTFQSRASAES